MKQDIREELKPANAGETPDAPTPLPEFNPHQQEVQAIITANTALIRVIGDLMREVTTEEPQRSYQLQLYGNLVAQLDTQIDQLRFQEAIYRLQNLVKGSLAEFLEQTADVLESALTDETKEAPDSGEVVQEASADIPVGKGSF